MTELIYLTDSYLFETSVKCIKIEETEKGTAIILDRTIFYPQGGGQPADTGTITCEDRVFEVRDVRLDGNGIVRHFGIFTTDPFESDNDVKLAIDAEKRILHARLHSAGHLLDCAIYKLKFDELIPIKGFHFAEGSHVEYEGVKEGLKAMIPEIQACVDDLLKQNLILESRDIPTDEVKAQGLLAPPGKSVRVVNFAGYPICGCGGTHIKSSSEIGKITIRKIKTRSGRTRISYSIS